MAQMFECLLCKLKALNSNSSTTHTHKKKKKKEKETRGNGQSDKSQTEATCGRFHQNKAPVLAD
jgi:hypothetical protein